MWQEGCSMGLTQFPRTEVAGVSLSRMIIGTNEETGTGLGLIVCNTMAQMAHGQLRFSSTQGEGSTFTLALPITESTFNKTR